MEGKEREDSRWRSGIGQSSYRKYMGMTIWILRQLILMSHAAGAAVLCSKAISGLMNVCVER